MPASPNTSHIMVPTRPTYQLACLQCLTSQSQYVPHQGPNSSQIPSSMLSVSYHGPNSSQGCQVRVPIRPKSGSQFVQNVVLVYWLQKREILWIRHWFSYLKLCENVRNMSNFAKMCGKHDIMRNCAEIAKLCEIVRWTSNCAIPHSPHWNGGYEWGQFCQNLRVGTSQRSCTFYFIFMTLNWFLGYWNIFVETL